MKQILINITIFISSVCALQAQAVIDTIDLPEVRLEHDRLRTHAIATDVEVFQGDDLGEFSSHSLADFLSENTSFYFKKYGALATPSFRGTSSAHTLVLWNGIPINSIANGLIDFSILPANTADELAIVYGGDGSVFGSGAIGGSVHLNSINNFKPVSYTHLTLPTKA